MELEKTRKGNIALAYLGIFMVLFAATVTMLSTVLPKLTERYSLTMSQVGTFTIVENYLAVFIGTFLILAIGDRVPKGVLIGVSAAAMGLLVFGIDALPAYGLLLALFSVTHLAMMIINNVVTAYAADLFPANRARYISVIHLFYSIGALLGPKLPGAVEALGFSWNHAYALIGILMLAAAVTYFPVLHKCGVLTYKLPAAPGNAQSDIAASARTKNTEGEVLTVRQILSHPMFISLCLLMIFYANGYQNIFSNWLQLFLQREYNGIYSASFTAACMTVFWAGMLVSRLFAIWSAGKITPVRFITVGSALGVLIQLLGLLANTRATWMLTCLLLGLCTGGIYALIHTVTISYFPQRSAAVTSLTGIFSALGGILLSFVMGKVADISFFTAMFLPVICLALVYFLMKMKFKETTDKWVLPRHRFYYTVLSPLIRALCHLSYRRLSLEALPRKDGRQYLVLYNHQTPFDQFFVSLVMNRPVYHIATEDLFSNGWVSRLIVRIAAPIPILKQKTDLNAVRTCVKVAKEGGTIAVAPEGNRTFDGRTTYINPAIAKLAKLLKLPVAVLRIEGGYGAQPRFSNVVRTGPVRAYISQVIEPDELKKMDPDALYGFIKEALWNDESGPAGGTTVYRSKKTAEYMERLFYVCPVCGFSKLESHGRRIFCPKCGTGAVYTEEKRLIGDSDAFPFETVGEWFDYQCGYVRQFYEGKLPAERPIAEDPADLFLVRLYKRKEPLMKNAALRLFADRIEVAWSGSAPDLPDSLRQDGKSHMSLSFNDISVLTVLGRNKLNLYYKDEVIQIKSFKQFNALKYVDLFQCFKASKEETQSG